jgi:hypothetical protein
MEAIVGKGILIAVIEIQIVIIQDGTGSSVVYVGEGKRVYWYK